MLLLLVCMTWHCTACMATCKILYVPMAHMICMHVTLTCVTLRTACKQCLELLRLPAWCLPLQSATLQLHFTDRSIDRSIGSSSRPPARLCRVSVVHPAPDTSPPYSFCLSLALVPSCAYRSKSFIFFIFIYSTRLASALHFYIKISGVLLLLLYSLRFACTYFKNSKFSISYQ
jgi:hypothetical protein